MNIIDNSPINAPSIGRIVTEEFYSRELVDCHLYLLPSNIGAIAESAQDVFNQLMERVGKEQLLNDYRLITLNENLDIEHCSSLYEAIREEKANFLMPLHTPDRADRQFLIANSEPNNLITNIPLMIYSSERITKQCVLEQIKMFVDEAPKEALRLFYQNVDMESFWKRNLVSAFANMTPFTFGMSAPKAVLKKQLGIKGKITHQDKLEMMERLEENFVKARHDKVADAELTLILGNLDAYTLKAFANSLNKNQRQMLAKLANTKRVAEDADTWLEVRFTGKIETDRRTKGRYRLIITDGKRNEPVEFANSDSLLVYLLYLIDIVIKDDVDTLNFDHYKDLFGRLSWEVYRFCDGEKRFEKIMKGRDGKGNLKAKQLSNCFSDIKNTFISACEKIGALPSPYIINGPEEHLYIRKNDILLPNELMNIVEKWAHTIGDSC